MSSVQEQIRKTAGEVLADGRADFVIGFGEGSLPMRATPCFITKPEDVDRLIWNSYCVNNLAVYLPYCFAPDPRLREQPPPPKVAIIVKGCDGRSAVGLIKERQVPRENLVIIAAPCDGMLDAGAALKLMKTDEILAAEESGNTVTVEDCTGKKTKLKREDLLAEACRACTHRAAPVHDIVVGDLPPDEKAPEGDDSFKEFESKPASERWEYFRSELSKCILCKSCRSACPNCYCKTCFAERTRPNWMGSGDSPRDVIVYHLGRMFHQAGRCVDCGACVRACPTGVDLRMFTYKLVKDAEELFGFTAGMDPEQAPMLTEFSADDSEDFITEPE